MKRGTRYQLWPPFEPPPSLPLTATLYDHSASALRSRARCTSPARGNGAQLRYSTGTEDTQRCSATRRCSGYSAVGFRLVLAGGVGVPRSRQTSREPKGCCDSRRESSSGPDCTQSAPHKRFAEPNPTWRYFSFKQNRSLTVPADWHMDRRGCARWCLHGERHAGGNVHAGRGRIARSRAARARSGTMTSRRSGA